MSLPASVGAALSFLPVSVGSVLSGVTVCIWFELVYFNVDLFALGPNVPGGFHD